MAEWDLAFVRKIARVTADALAPSIRGCCDQIVRVAVSVVEFLLTAALIVRRVPADAKCSWWVLFFGARHRAPHSRDFLEWMSEYESPSLK
jgi:hypothetical protein